MNIDPWLFCKAGTVVNLSTELSTKASWADVDFDLKCLKFERLMQLGALQSSGLKSSDQASCCLLDCQVHGFVGSPITGEFNADGFSELGQHCVRIEGRAKLDLQCEDCQGTMNLIVPFARTVVLVRSEQQADALDSSLAEDMDAIACGDWLNIQDLIEDEILLSMPMYPRHETCPGNLGKPEQSQTQQPFADLAGLLKAARSQ